MERSYERKLESINKTNIWELVYLPKDRKLIWILRKKLKLDGALEGIYYEETYSLVAKFTFIRIIMAIVAHLDLELYHMDVKTIFFLNGELKEETYIRQLERYEIRNENDKVCKFNRSLYGLKQLSRQWYCKFHDTFSFIWFCFK